MNARKRSASIGALLVAALATSIAPASAATTTTRWVDGDGHAGPNGCNSSHSAYKQIQKAVNASNEDDTVIVCPGTYRQQVRIRGDRDGLTLKSSTPFGATILTPSSPEHVDGGVFLVSVEKVDGVTVRGFKVLARTDGPCDDTDVGIFVVAPRKRPSGAIASWPPAAFGPGSSCELGIGIAGRRRVVRDSSARSASALVGFNEVRDAVGGGIIAVGESRMVRIDAVHNSVRAYFHQTTNDLCHRVHHRRRPVRYRAVGSGQGRGPQQRHPGLDVRTDQRPVLLSLASPSGRLSPVGHLAAAARSTSMTTSCDVWATARYFRRMLIKSPSGATRSATPTTASLPRRRRTARSDATPSERKRRGVLLSRQRGQPGGVERRLRRRRHLHDDELRWLRHGRHRQPLGRQHGDGREQPGGDLRHALIRRE